MRKFSFSWKMAYSFLGGLSVLLIIRSFFGVDLTDESFYFALAKRFSQEDGLLVDEWFPTQLIGALLLPFYNVYIRIHGNQEGVILCARIIYVLFSTAISAYMLYVFRKNGRSCGYSFLVSILFSIYVRASIGTFSYYSLGLETFLLSLLLLIDGKISDKPEWKWMMSGISFSISVICMPYMVLFFVVVSFVYFYSRKSNSSQRVGIYFLLGIFIAAGVFLVFYGAQLFEGIKNIPEILLDPQHQGSMWENVLSTIEYLCLIYLRFTWPIYGMTFIIGIYIRIKRVQYQKVLDVYRWILYLEFFAQAAYSRTFFEGGIVFAILLLALQIQLINFLICEKELETYFLIPGLGFGIIWIIGSNVGMRVFNMGFLLADVWALKVIIEDSKNIKGFLSWFRNIVVGILVGVLLINRFLDVYRDNTIWDLDTKVTIGSMKGLYTTKERAMEYEIVVLDLIKYTKYDDRLAVLGLNPWIYLESPAKCGTFSVWNIDFEDGRNWSYYEKNSENIPNIIFLLEPSYGKYSGWRFGSHGSNNIGSGVESVEGYLDRLLMNENYEEIKCIGGTFYRIER